jgi:hypothetical protein
MCVKQQEREEEEKNVLTDSWGLSELFNNLCSFSIRATILIHFLFPHHL